MTQLIVGIDPGLHGGIAFFNTSPGGFTLDAFPLPTFTTKAGKKQKTHLDPVELGKIIDCQTNSMTCHVFLEKVGAMPGQGVCSMFAFGEAYGMIQGIIGALCLPITFVTPQVWKKALGVHGDKDASRARATQLFPKSAGLWSRVKDDGVAEAALIAEYGFRSLFGEGRAE